MDAMNQFGVLLHDLHGIFDARLRAVVSYGDNSGLARVPSPTLVVVDTLTADDLRACAARTATWHDEGVATPLLIPADELRRSLDVFPMEFCVILADHRVIHGTDPFAGLVIERAELRRACEVQVRSHLLHLREAYLETEGRGDHLVDVIRRSAPSLSALLTSVNLLERQEAVDARSAIAWVESRLGRSDGVFAAVVSWTGRADVPSAEARDLWPRYLDAVTKLSEYVDRWGN